MDFSNVKSITIPEGDTASISVDGVVIWSAEETIEKLITPSISLDNGLLVIQGNDERATHYVILVNGAVFGSTTAIMFDLSSLQLSAGVYEIAVKARANGYEESDPSNAVSYLASGTTPDPEEPAPDEPLFPDPPYEEDTSINEKVEPILTIEGAWYFNEYPDIAWLGRVMSILTGRGFGSYTVYIDPDGDGNLTLVELKFSSNGIFIGSNSYHDFYGKDNERLFVFSEAQEIPYNLAYWMLANATPVELASTFMATKARMVYGKGQIKKNRLKVG